MIIFNGKCKDWENHSTENGEELSAKECNGTSEYKFSVKSGKPSAVEIESSFDKGDMKISIQVGDRLESVTSGNCKIDLNDCADGEYTIKTECKNAVNISVKYNFV